MASLTSSGQISLSDIATNHGIASSNVSLKNESIAFASGSVVDGDPAQTSARKNIEAAPYAVSEFYDADYANSQFDNPVAKFGTSTESDGFVDGETARIYVDVNQQINNTIRGGLKLKTDDSVAVVGNIGTNLSVADNSHYVNVTVPAAASTDERYYAFADIVDSFKSAAGSTNLDHYDAIGVVTITDPSDTTVAANSTETDITHARSIGDESDITSYAWTYAKSSGDGSNPSPTSATTTTPTVTYTGVGIFTANLTVYGEPTNARNYTAASAVSHKIAYVDETSVPGGMITCKGGDSVTISGSHEGFTGGVTFGIVTASAATTMNVSTPNTRNETTDSEVTSTNYSGAFTLPDSVFTRYFAGRVIDKDDGTTGQNRNTSTFTVYPKLTTSRNVINPTSQTIYSTTRNTDTGTYPTSFTFSAPTSRTSPEPISGRTYSESSGHISISANATPASQIATQATVLAAGTVDASEDVTYTVIAASGDGTTQTTATTCAVTINYSKELYSVGGVTVGGDFDTINDSLSFSYSWQGFSLGSTRLELMEASDGTTQRGSDIDNDWGGTAGSERTAQGSGTISLTSQVTSPANGFGYSTAGTFKIKVSVYDGGSQSTLIGSALTSAFTTYAISNITSTLKGVSQDSEFVQYESILQAAENDDSGEGTANQTFLDVYGGSNALYAFNTNVGSKISTTNTLSGTFDFDQADEDQGWYHYSGTVLTIDNGGIVTSRTDGTPATPTAISAVSSSVNDYTWDVTVAGVTTVTRNVILYYGSSNGATTYAKTFAATAASGSSANSTTSALDIRPVGGYGTDIYFSARFVNDTPESGSVFSFNHAHPNPEIADAITVNDISNVNEGATITISGNQSGLSTGVRFGMVTDGGTTHNLSDPNYRDDSTDSRYTLDAYTGTFVVPAQTTTTTDYDLYTTGESGNTARSTTFKVYPSVNDEFGADDIAISVDPVIVGSNTVLSIARNITDNIVGYRWSEDGSGNMTSDNLSGGDIDGTSVDGTSIINEYSSTTTNTVSFDTAEANKTIGLILYGKLSQTSTKRTKTLNVELANATTIGGMISCKGGDTVTISGSQAGLSGGVTFGVASASAATTMNLTTPNTRDDTTDSRYSSDNWNGSFVLPDSTYTRYYSGRVIDKGDSTTDQNRNTSTFTVYPKLTTSRNVINPTSQTIYSSTRNTDTGTYPTSFTFSAPTSRTSPEPISSRTYSEGSSHISIVANATPSSQTNAQATVAASTTVDASENVTYTVVAASGDGTTQTTATTCAVTINYSKELYSLSTVSVGGDNDTVNDSLSFSFSWQGFSLGSTRIQLYETDESTKRGSDIDNDWGGTAGSERTAQGSGTISLTSQGTSVPNGFGYSTAGTFKIKVSIYDGASQSTLIGAAFTDAFTTNAISNITSTLKGVEQDNEFVQYESILQAAENDDSSEGTHNQTFHDVYGGSNALYAFNTNVGSKISTTNTLSGTFDFDQADEDEGWYHYSGTVLTIDNGGIVTSRTDGTPATPTAISVASSSTSDETWDVTVTGVTTVARNVILYYGNSNGATTYAKTFAATAASGSSANSTTSALDISSIASGNDVYFSARFVNDTPESGSVFTYNHAHPTQGANWTLVPSNFTLTAYDPGFGDATATSPAKTWSVADGSGNTTFTFVQQSGTNMFNEQFAVGTSSSPTNWTNPGGTITLATATNPESYYLKVRHDHKETLEGNSGVYRVTATNSVISATCDVTLTVSELEV